MEDTNITLVDAVQKLQNIVIKAADGRARKYGHVTPLFNELEWLCIRKAILFNTAVTIYKQINDYYPQHDISLTTVTGRIGSRTRQQDQRYVPRTNTHSGGRSFSPRAPVLWNKFPPGINEASIQIFATHLKSYHLTHDFT